MQEKNKIGEASYCQITIVVIQNVHLFKSSPEAFSGLCVRQEEEEKKFKWISFPRQLKIVYLRSEGHS